jgi:hypothetical protein
MFTKDLEVIDFFTVMLAIRAGGVLAGIFGASIMLFSRLFGPNEWYLYTIKDAICLLVGGLTSPLVFTITRSPLLTLYIFTIQRYVLYLILTIIIEPEYLGLELGLSATGATTAYLSNTLIMRFFEKPLNKAFEGGLHFSWELLLYTTLVIGAFYGISKAAKWYEIRRLTKETPAQRLTDEQLRWKHGTGIGLYKYYH